jgi:hypothetical protein
LFAVRKNSDLAVYFSTGTRDFTQNAETRYQRPMVAWMQAAYLSGLNMDMVFQDDPVETLAQHRVILASHAAMISGEQLERLRQYVHQGGTLVAVGDFGIFDGNGREQNAYAAFGLNIQTKSLPAKRITFSYNGRQIINAYAQACIAPGGDGIPVIRDNDGNVIAASKDYGQGKIIVMPASVVGSWFQEAINFLYQAPPGQTAVVNAPAYHVDNLRHSAGNFLKGVIGAPVVDMQINNPDILGFYHINRDGTAHAVKLLNITETFVKENRRITDTEPIAHFGLNAAKLPFAIEVSIPDIKDFTPGKAILSTPEKPDAELEIPVEKKNGRLHFTVPANYFSGFALVELSPPEDPPSGNGSGKNLPENPLHARIEDGMLYMSGLTVGDTLSVYTSAGAMVYHSIAASNESKIKLNEPGVYIVHSDNKSIKVAFNTRP